MTEARNALKEAKKAMKDNDFEAVSKHCKIALKHDRKNYNALLFFGRACQELGKAEDAKKALMMATQVEPENSVAWQGLAQLYEKQVKLATLQEITNAFTTLAHLLQGSDVEKSHNAYRRLAAVQLERGDQLGAAETLTALAGRLTEKRYVTEVWQNVTQILSAIQDLPEEHLPKLQESLEHSLNESVLGENERNHQTNIKLLYRTRQRGRPGVAVAALNMCKVFPTAYPLEWICRIYVEMNARPIEGEVDFPLNGEEVVVKVKRLLTLNTASVWGNLAQGLLFQRQGKLQEAKAHMRLGADRAATNLLAWKLLLDTQVDNGDWPGVEVTCRRSLEAMIASPNATIPDDNKDAEEYRTSLKLMQARAFVHMGHKNHLRQAVDILSKDAEKELDCAVLLVQSRIKLLDFDAAKTDLERLTAVFGEVQQLRLMAASLLAAQGERQQAQQLLQKFVKEEPGCAEGHLELGRLYYLMGQYGEAQLSLMRAGKLDPKLAHPFLYLGHFYRRDGKMDRALKCYERAHSLAPGDDLVGAALSDIYRVLGKHEENLVLLERVTRGGGRAGGGWAWLRLGLHHLATHNPQDATYALQCALTISPDDSAGYECLGDAYMARGAYSAALKVFTAASQLNPSALYPLYQIAHIKQLTGEMLEAVSGYEDVVKCEPDREVRVVALVGLAEALLASGRRAADQAMFANLRDTCTAALSALTRAGSLEPESVCIWKLVGDACTLMHPVPPSLTPITVPARLVSREAHDLDETTQLGKLEVLQLGARCYGSALRVSDDDTGLWHDLGANLYQQGRVMEEGGDDAAAKSLLQRAVLSLRRSLAILPTNGRSWTSLGVVASHKLVNDPGLAQHCLIRGCELAPSASTWTHLGSFYLTQGDPNLAHEAFSQAQALDPAYVSCWVGQALVAENVGHSETVDLFRHTTLLGIHAESCLGYGHHLTKRACDPSLQTNTRIQAALKNALPTLTDCTHFYTREHEEDPIGLNMAGLSLEMAGLHQSAVNVYTTALAAARKAKVKVEGLEEGVQTNLGRVLGSWGRAKEAMESLSTIKGPDFFTQCTLALASLKAGQFEESYNGYTAALHWSAKDDSQKSHVLVALAALQYKFQNTEEAKKLLFQGSQLTNASVYGLLALAALGLVLGDEVLSSAALAELTPHKHNKDYLSHVGFLTAAHAALKGKERDARLILSRTIHEHPGSAGLWRSLAHVLLTTTPPKTTAAAATTRCQAAATCAASAARLAQAAGHTQTLAQDAVTSALAQLGVQAAGQRRKDNTGSASGLRDAQRAVLMCPGSPEAWAALVAARLTAGHSQVQTGQVAGIWAGKATPAVSSWLQTVAARATMAA